MPSPETSHAQTKREERDTYRELKLAGALKTRAQRARAERNGVHTVIGGNALERPPLKVKTVDYQRVRLEVTRHWLKRAKSAGLELDLERLQEGLRPQIELDTYDRLAAASLGREHADHAFAGQAGRRLTAEERRRFEQVAQMESPRQATDDRFPAAPAQWTAHNRRENRRVIDRVVGHIADRQTHNPVRYRTAWAEAVGAETAQQSELARVDAEAGVVYFRCLNSTLSYRLQRDAKIPRRLARSLGLPVRRLRICY
ncbi:MAG: hypothetical protein AAGK14_13210 [Verrucomicrobiota bacterium]